MANRTIDSKERRLEPVSKFLGIPIVGEESYTSAFDGVRDRSIAHALRA
jgi:hypothetical protein